MTIRYNSPLSQFGYAGYGQNRDIKGTYSYGSVSLVRKNDGNRELIVSSSAARSADDGRKNLLLRKLGLSEKLMGCSYGEILHKFWGTMPPSGGQKINFLAPLTEAPFAIPPRANTLRDDNPYINTGVMENDTRSDKIDYGYGFSFMPKYDKAVHGPDLANNPISGIVDQGRIDIDGAAALLTGIETHVMDGVFDQQEYYAKFYEAQRNALKQAAADGTLVQDLTSFLENEYFEYTTLKGDLEKSVEDMAVRIGKLYAVYTELLIDDTDFQSVMADVDKSVAEAIEKAAGEYSRIYAEYFRNGDAGIGDDVLKDVFSGVLASRSGAYFDLYSSGEVSTRHSNRSVQYYMYDAIGKDDVSDPYEITIETSIGAISYGDLSRANEAIHAFENLPDLGENVAFGEANTALNTEHIGIRLGLAQMRVRMLDNGSTLMTLVKNSTRERLDAIIDKYVLAAKEAYSPDKSYHNVVTEAGIREAMALFENVERGDISMNIIISMQKLSRQYEDRRYTGVPQKGHPEPSIDSNHVYSYMDDVMKEASKAVYEYDRMQVFLSVQNAYLAEWNEWVSTNSFIQDASKFLLSSDYHRVDISL